MTGAVSNIAFTPAVKAERARRGSRAAYARMARIGDWADTVDDRLAEFIAERDSFYLSAASADEQPYNQHCDGPTGSLKVLDGSRWRSLIMPATGKSCRSATLRKPQRPSSFG